MNDTTSVLENREEIVKEPVTFPLDFANTSTVGVFDKLSVQKDERKATIPNSLSEVLRDLPSLDSMMPRMSRLLDEQIERWLGELKDRPDNAYLLNNLGNAYLSRGRVEEAIGCFQEALRNDKGLASARASLAKSYMMLDQIDKALEIYLDEGMRHPKNTAILMNLAHVYTKQGKLGEALDALDRIACLEPNNSAAHHNRGVVHLLEGRVERAISAFRKAVASEERFAAAYNALGVCYALMGSYRRAVRFLLASQALDSAAVSTTKNLAVVHQLNGEFADAARIMDVYLAKYSKDPEARNIAAFSYFKLGEYKRSLLHLDRLKRDCEELEVRGDRLAIVLNNVGVVLRHMGQLPNAIELYRMALATYEHASPVTCFNLADLYLEVGKEAEAVALVDDYLAKEPNNYVGLILLSKFYYNQGEIEKAERVLSRALDVRPESRDALILLTAIYCEVGEDYDKAIAFCERGLAIAPNDHIFLNNLAYSYLMKGMIQEARVTLDRIRWDDTYFYAYATKGLLRICEGKVSEGEDLYDHAANLAPSPDLKRLVKQKKRIEVARYLLAHGEKSRAVSQLRSAQSIKTRYGQYQKQAERMLLEMGNSDL